MKYLKAFLKDEEISAHPREDEPLKTQEIFSAFSAGAEGRSIQEFEHASEPLPWPCEHCGNPAEIEAVEPSLDGQRILTYWHCEPCQTHGVTPDTIRQPPVWVSRREQ